jgi:hypothetical protein
MIPALSFTVALPTPGSLLSIVSFRQESGNTSAPTRMLKKKTTQMSLRGALTMYTSERMRQAVKSLDSMSLRLGKRGFNLVHLGFFQDLSGPRGQNDLLSSHRFGTHKPSRVSVLDIQQDLQVVSIIHA